MPQHTLLSYYCVCARVDLRTRLELLRVTPSPASTTSTPPGLWERPRLWRRGLFDWGRLDDERRVDPGGAGLSRRVTACGELLLPRFCRGRSPFIAPPPLSGSYYGLATGPSGHATVGGHLDNAHVVVLFVCRLGVFVVSTLLLWDSCF